MEKRENESYVEELLSRALLVRNRPQVPVDIVDRVPAEVEDAEDD